MSGAPGRSAHVLRRAATALALALAGAAAGAASLALAWSRAPEFALEMDRDLPAAAAGFHPVERVAGTDLTFAWTTALASLSLEGADRRVAWTCAVTFRGGRGPSLKQPLVELAVDDVALGAKNATNEFEELAVRVPPRPGKRGLSLAILVSPTFVPGPGDPRALGVQVDRVACRPEAGTLALPPRRALGAAAASGAAMGALLSLLLSAPVAAAAAVLVTLAQAWPLAAGLAVFTAYPVRLAWMAAWIALVTAGGLALARWRLETPLRPAARVAVAVSAVACFLELAGLLHPSKPLVDALFQAHRFEWVLSGRFFFTQPMPSGVQFPYAIGLFVFAAPWAALTDDHVSLLRIVVVACRALSGLALYPLAARAWGDTRAGAIAVALLHVAPLPFAVIGNANLTFAFGQAAATVAWAGAAAWIAGTRRWWAPAALFAVAALALLSHVGVFPVLLATLLAMAALYRAFGGSDLRRPARIVAATAVLAALFSVVTYYARFDEAYESLARVRASTSGRAAQPSAEPEQGRGEYRDARSPAAREREAAAAHPLPRRIAAALWRGVAAVGLPLFLLAIAGAWRTWSAGPRERVALAIAAAALVYLGFLVAAVASPVEPRFLRYTDEFLDRLAYSTMPAVVLLAARGASWAWESNAAARVGAAALLAAAAWLGWVQWAGWLH